MITTAIVNLVWQFAEPVLDRIPVIEINGNGITSSVLQYLRAGLYFLPVNTFVQILTLVAGLWLLRVAIAFLHSLWASLPIF